MRAVTCSQYPSMNLAPVVDVNNNPLNPVIGVRSFSEDPDLVARLCTAALKGYHEAGVLATIKHFTGHGDIAIDSHLASPTIWSGWTPLSWFPSNGASRREWNVL